MADHEIKVNNLIRILLGILAILLFLILYLLVFHQDEAESAADYNLTYRLAESQPSDYPTTKADYEFARLVEEESNGRIQIRVYEDKELGEEVSVIDQVGFGGVDFARVSIGTLAETIPELNVLQLPYLYEDDAHMWRVLDSEIGDYFLSKVSDYGYIGLAWYDAGARSFYNSEYPITSVEDLAGLNIRIMESSMMYDIVNQLGANPIKIPYGQVYSSLQLHEIDGAENNFPSYESSQHYEIAKFYSVDEHIRIPEMLIASKKALENLSEDDLEILRNAAKETEIYQRELWTDKDEEVREFLESEGIEINTISDKSEFIELMEPIYEKYQDDYGEMLETIQSMKDNE